MKSQTCHPVPTASRHARSIFNNLTQDRVDVSRAAVTQLDFLTRLSPISNCARTAGPTVAEQWDHADAVVHVQLSESTPGSVAREGYYRHAATVRNSLKLPPGVSTGPTSVLQNQFGTSPEPVADSNGRLPPPHISTIKASGFCSAPTWNRSLAVRCWAATM